jgi:hypothetical protein
MATRDEFVHVKTRTKTQIRQWEANYKAVFDFAKRNGHLKLSTKDPKERRLSNWLSRQQRRSTMPLSERIKLKELEPYQQVKKLEEDIKWMKYLNYYVLYKKEFGSAKLVPKKDSPMEGLNEWVRYQRLSWKNQTLSSKRTKLLEEHGFIFKPNKEYTRVEKKRFTVKQENQWNEWFGKLCDYKEVNGDCEVKWYEDKDHTLAQWVCIQRNEFTKGTIDEARKRKLNKLGFTWRIQRAGRTIKKVAEVE